MATSIRESFQDFLGAVGVKKKSSSINTSIILPQRTDPVGISVTPTFNPSAAGQVLTAPAYREHLTDIFTSRAANDSRAMIKDLLRSDPDMSAALNAFLTLANTDPVFLVRNLDGTLDPAGQQLLSTILISFTVASDYTIGFQMPKTLTSITEAMRYMLLMRGGIASELVLSQDFVPTELRHVDMGTLQWLEPEAGQYVPRQLSKNGEIIDLNIPTFFTSWFRRDPTDIYSYSPFISAITTIAARQQVINDLYRIMQVTGYPRMEAVVLEEVILKNMPQNVKLDESKKREYMNAVIGSIQGTLSSLRPDQTFVHTDSVEVGVLNEKTAGMTMDISPIISTLNAQNQAGLKTMATILGRGEAGVNTASVEARIFSLSAQAINEPVSELLQQALTLAIRLNSSQSYVECYFKPVEMKSETELEAMMLVKSQRLKEDLSLGLITDQEYHLMVYNRLPPPGVPVLSGTGFATSNAGNDVVQSASSSIDKQSGAIGGNKPARDNKTKPTTR